VFAFFVLQRIGAVAYLAKFDSRISGTKGRGTMVDNVKDVDVAVREVYGDQIRFWWSVFVRLLARFAMSLEVWLAAYLMGHPIGLIEAFMFRSLIATVRGAAFFVPQGLGVQEAAFIVLGGLVGVPPGIALSISLATRVRELIESFTGILLWQHLEGKSLWALFRNGKQG
ncbi:MAG: lysylphosphatidylglycerol synthase domain-containing protein, partial [Roseovarius confluentis]